jgi:hypothetical protein
MTDLSHVTAVAIASSSKFYPTAKKVARGLSAQGLTVFTPRFDYDEELVEVTPADKVRLTREFLDKIARSDAVYVIDESGYTGRSVCVEVGYAAALGKTIILSEPAVEGAIAALTDTVVPVDAIRLALTTDPVTRGSRRRRSPSGTGSPECRH